MSDDEIQALREEARSLPSRSLRPFAESHAQMLGCHWSTVYRAVSRDAKQKRQQRSDAGAMKVMDDETFDTIAAMVVQYDYDVELALDTLNANRAKAGEAALDVHPETVRRQLRQKGVSRRHNKEELRAHTRFEAPYPNYLFQMDSTVAASYYIDKDDSIGYEAAVARNKNKPGNERTRIWMLAGVDDYSRVRWARFYPANSALCWQDFMLRCWRGFHPDPNTWPAFGVPERIYTDQDSAMKSRINVKALELLGVERMLARPSTAHETNAQAKGKIEAAIRILQDFEKRTRWSRFPNLEQMNDALLLHLLFVNNRPHSTTKYIPFERFLHAQRIRVLPAQEITRRMSYREEVRRIGNDLRVQLQGKTYQLPTRRPFVDFVGRKMMVRYLDADLSKIYLELNGEEHEIEAIEALAQPAGEYSKPETPAAVEKKRELLKHDLSGLDPHAVTEYRVTRDPRLYPIRPARLEPAVPELPLRLIKRGKAIDRAQELGVIGRPPSALEQQLLDGLFDGRGELPESELREWLDARVNAATAQRVLRTGEQG